MKGWCRHTEAHLHRQKSPHSCHYSMLHIHLKSRHDSTYIQESLTLRWCHKGSCYGMHRAKVMLSFLRQLQRFWNWQRPSRSKCLTLTEIVATCKLNFTLVLFTSNKPGLPSSVVFHVWQAGRSLDSLAVYMARSTINCSTMQEIYNIVVHWTRYTYSHSGIYLCFCECVHCWVLIGCHSD